MMKTISSLMLGLALLTCACIGAPPVGDGQTTTTTVGDVGTDESDEGEDPEPDAGLVVLVWAQPGYPSQLEPAQGAIVAVDTPDGRLEVFTDAEGRAVFEDFEWSGAAIDVTAALPEFRLRSRLGLVEGDANEDGEIEIEVDRSGVSDGPLEISGPVLNKTSDSHDVIIGVEGGTGFWNSSLQWSSYVLPDQAFGVVALEISYVNDGGWRSIHNPIYGWFVTHSEGIVEDTVLPVDFAEVPPSTVVEGSFMMPANPDSILRADSWSFISVTTNHGHGPMVGRAIRTAVSDDGETCDFEIGVVSPAWAQELRTCYRLNDPDGANYNSSTSCLDGPPEVSVPELDFLEPPIPAPVANRGLHDPIEFANIDEGVRAEVNVMFQQQSLWFVTGPLIGPDPNASITIPAPPTGFENGGAGLDLLLRLSREVAGMEGIQAYCSSPAISAQG